MSARSAMRGRRQRSVPYYELTPLATSLIVLVRSVVADDHQCKLYERATKRHLATARGSADYVRKASGLFANEWAAARAEKQQATAERERCAALSAGQWPPLRLVPRHGSEQP